MKNCMIFYTSQTAARAVGVHPSTLSRYCRELRFPKHAGRYIIVESDIPVLKQYARDQGYAGHRK